MGRRVGGLVGTADLGGDDHELRRARERSLGGLQPEDLAGDPEGRLDGPLAATHLGDAVVVVPRRARVDAHRPADHRGPVPDPRRRQERQEHARPRVRVDHRSARLARLGELPHVHGDVAVEGVLGSLDHGQVDAHSADHDPGGPGKAVSRAADRRTRDQAQRDGAGAPGRLPDQAHAAAGQREAGHGGAVPACQDGPQREDARAELRARPTVDHRAPRSRGTHRLQGDREEARPVGEPVELGGSVCPARADRGIPRALDRQPGRRRDADDLDGEHDRERREKVRRSTPGSAGEP